MPENTTNEDYRVTAERQSVGCYAAKHAATKDFMDEIMAVCKKHNLALLPTYEGDISFHNSMRVVPLEDDGVAFIMDAGVYFEP